MSTFIILAAGSGTRFGSDKLLEPINGRTLPERAAQFAVRNGASRICVTVNRKSVMTDGNHVYSPVFESVLDVFPDAEMAFQDEECYGPGAAIQAWEGKVEEDFTVLFGDNLYEGKLPPMSSDITHFSVRTLKTSPRNLQLAAVVDGYVVEKPHSILSGDFFCGFAHFPTNFFGRLPELRKSARGEYEIADMINMLGKPLPVNLDDHGIRWGDITYKSDISILEEMTK